MSPRKESPLARAIDIALDRRKFLAAAGGAAMLAHVPLAVAATRAGPVPAPGLLDDWTIDDMWGVYPRHAEPIGYGRPASEPAPAADLADLPFIT